MRKIFFTYFLAFIFLTSVMHGQSVSTVEKKHKQTDDKASTHSPRLAMIFSACVPGLGQAYNKKYWKIPIVYATIGTTVYFFDHTNKIYKEYKQAYINKTDSLPETIDLYPTIQPDALLTSQNEFRRYRDLNILLTALFYTLNIVDAYVDAQLMTFDVSDDLSLDIHPALNLSAQRKKPSIGLMLSFKF